MLTSEKKFSFFYSTCQNYNFQVHLQFQIWITLKISFGSRAQPDWAYEFPDRTGPDTQICRTGTTEPERTYISNHFTYQVHIINSHKIRSLDTNLVSKDPRPNR